MLIIHGREEFFPYIIERFCSGGTDADFACPLYNNRSEAFYINIHEKRKEGK